MKEELIAPCGMNYAICSQYLALKHNVKSRGIRIPYCIGCRARGKKCAFIKKGCDLLSEGKTKDCFECSDFPCHKLKSIDERYRKHHRMSMIINLEYIKKKGMNHFLMKEQERWKCPECGGFISCHNGLFFSCDFDKLSQKKPKYKYRWEEK